MPVRYGEKVLAGRGAKAMAAKSAGERLTFARST
jgi:hypothetical protein